jgi:hypothetical protein
VVWTPELRFNPFFNRGPNLQRIEFPGLRESRTISRSYNNGETGTEHRNSPPPGSRRHVNISDQENRPHREGDTGATEQQNATGIRRRRYQAHTRRLAQANQPAPQPAIERNGPRHYGHLWGRNFGTRAPAAPVEPANPLPHQLQAPDAESISSQSEPEAEAEPVLPEAQRLPREEHGYHPGRSPARIIRDLHDQNTALRAANIEVKRAADYERSQLTNRIQLQEADLVRTENQLDALRETLRNQRRASASDRNHLNAHQQIARYGTPRFPIHPEVIDTDSDDAPPARNRPRNI